MSYDNYMDYAELPSISNSREKAIAALSRYELLDTPPENALDNLARLVAYICDTPIALITLVDEHRQWFKSHIGIETTEAPLELGFCPLVTATCKSLIIPDTCEDPRYADNPIVTSAPHIRFYAGVPLMTPEGDAIGTLCVLDLVPRQLTEARLSVMELLASEVMVQLELRRVNQTFDRHHQENARLKIAAEQEGRKRAESEQERAYVMSSAHCLLWYADITESDRPDLLRWSARFVDVDAAQRFLPLEILPGETYQSARYRARLPEDRAACDQLGTNSIRAGKSYSQEFRCRAQDGTIHWMHEDVHIETVVEGKQWRAVGVCTDISEAKQAELALQESERLYRTLGEAVPDFIWACSADGQPFYFNKRMTDYVGPGLGNPDLIPMDVLHHPEDFPRLVETWKHAEANLEPYELEFRFRRHDGEYRWFLARAVPVKDEQGRLVQWIGTTTDIHERKMVEVDLRLHQKEIEKLNAQLRSSVEVTHHHVRNSMQIILALAQLPIEDGVETVPISALRRIEHHVSSLAAIHDQLMHRAKIDARVDSLSARTALDSLVPLLKTTSRGRNIQCHVEEIVLPIQEIGSLCLLVNELVVNAIQHGSGGILLTMTAQDGSARLEVCDEGRGFPTDFEWSVAAKTGLCLIDTVSRYDLRGRVLYENRAEGGARVVVEFPVTNPS